MTITIIYLAAALLTTMLVFPLGPMTVRGKHSVQNYAASIFLGVLWPLVLCVAAVAGFCGLVVGLYNAARGS